MVAFVGSVNCTLTTIDAPGARLAGAEIVMYGVPEFVPVALTRVTFGVNPLKRS
jgi:hypothetical protein